MTAISRPSGTPDPVAASPQRYKTCDRPLKPSTRAPPLPCPTRRGGTVCRACRPYTRVASDSSGASQKRPDRSLEYHETPHFLRYGSKIAATATISGPDVTEVDCQYPLDMNKIPHRGKALAQVEPFHVREPLLPEIFAGQRAGEPHPITLALARTPGGCPKDPTVGHSWAWESL